MSYLKHLETLEDKFGRLDELPDSLYTTIVTHSHGVLNDRIKGILQWRDAFLNGQLPDETRLVWPDQFISRMILKRVEVLDIVQYCQEQPELTDLILKDVCEAIGSAEQWQEIDPGFDDKLAREQKQRDRDSPFKDPELPGQEQQHSAHDLQEPDPQKPDLQKPEPQVYPQERESQTNEQQQLEQQSPHSSNTDSSNINDGQGDTDEQQKTGSMESPFSQSIIHTPDSLEMASRELQSNDTLLEQQWQELSQQWQQLAPVLSELSGFMGRGWDLTQGFLSSQGWRDIIRYRQLVRDLPWLEQVIAALGRLRELSSDETKSVSEQVFEPVKRVIEEDIEVRTPHAVYETSGIRRSDDITRLLPGELAQLGHPQLNLLWHAKRAEHTLLTYRVDGVYSEHESIEQEVIEQVEQTKPETEQGYGPIVVCLDSSASMQGEAENIAKALVLEALNMAWHENRACFVYLFSGPAQTLHHTLDLAQGGLAELLTFLTQSFNGGTDVIKPLLQALSMQKQEQWQKADVLLVTDGRFPVTQEQKQQLNRLRKQSDSRVHGVLIGQWKGEAMQSLCDNFHRISSTDNSARH